MKLIIREYLASLKEREELDAILPDLLSGLGFNVYSRPKRGTTQHGVDVAAVKREPDGEEKVYLFSVKQGDLTRQDWNGTLQSLRPSIDEILDVYINTRIPKRLRDKRIVICLCFGGDIQEQVRASVTGYTEQRANERISFEEWNGDKLAELLLSGILREEILPKAHRSSFQKAVAMVDEPDIAYKHFANLVKQLTQASGVSAQKRVTAARQLYICLWILFVWARDSDNVDAPYRASELVLLAVWDLLRPHIEKKTGTRKALIVVLDQVIKLHLTIISAAIDEKVLPLVGVLHGLSMAVQSHNAVDVNLKLFDLLGRIAMAGLWAAWVASRSGKAVSDTMKASVERWTQNAFTVIENNPTLLSPLCDQHAIEIGLVLQLALSSNPAKHDIRGLLRELTGRMNFALRIHGRYPCIFTDYRDLINHPRERTEGYRKEATEGSILIPLLAAWLTALQETDSLRILAELKQSILGHCTFQLWLPDETTEAELYSGGQHHGVVLSDLPISADGNQILETISEACKNYDSFTKLSAIETDFWPIILVACRHYRYPIPPHFWIESLLP